MENDVSLNNGRVVQFEPANPASASVMMGAGNVADSVIAFIAPASGQIKIETTNVKNAVNNKLKGNTGITDVMRFRIYKNDERIYPTGANDPVGYANGLTDTQLAAGYTFPMQYKDWMVFAKNSELDFTPMYVNVQAGDRIYFRVNKGSDAPNNTADKDGFTYQYGGDNLLFAPVVSYETVAGPTPSFTLTPPQFTQLNASRLKVTASAFDDNVSGVPAAFIIAKYGEGKLVEVFSVNQKAAADCALDVSEFVSVGDCNIVKVFVWDGAGGLKPYPGAVSEWEKPEGLLES
jgi:plastocyanin